MSKQQILINVRGMSCSHCENRIKRALKAESGVSDVIISLQEQTVTVEYDTAKNNTEKFKEVIIEQGYDVI